MSEFKVFVADDVNDAKLEPLREAGIEVVKKTKLAGEELAREMADADGVIVRSATKITADLMDAAPKLRAVGRAGVGVDNIDIKAATERGIVVMNAPDGNTITTAEHTFALLVSLARNVPQAHSKLQGGEWDKKSFVGVELYGKTLGVIGLGRIGRHVAQIAQGYGMNVFGYDPYLSAEQAGELGFEVGGLDDLFAEADFISIHTPVTDQTRGIIGEAAFGKMKPGVRIINCARGGLIDEEALLRSIESGTVAGAALDVYAVEPLGSDSPLLKNPAVITTPHLGASTKEAQEGVAQTVAEQLRDYLLTGEVRNAVNAPSLAADELKRLEPYLDLAERLGKFQSQVISGGGLRKVSVSVGGKLNEEDTTPVSTALLTGLLSEISDRVNVVNAVFVAEERGIEVETSFKEDHSSVDVETTVWTSGSNQTACGKVFEDGEGRITQVGDFSVEAVPHGHMLFTKNKDVPGVIGKIGTLLGENGINISRFYLGRSEQGGEALAVFELDTALANGLIDDIQALDPVITARQVDM